MIIGGGKASTRTAEARSLSYVFLLLTIRNDARCTKQHTSTPPIVAFISLNLDLRLRS